MTEMERLLFGQEPGDDVFHLGYRSNLMFDGADGENKDGAEIIEILLTC